MNWVTKTLSSTLGRKLLMSLTGLFLITFLTIHLIGNLALFKGDGGEAFNAYAAIMSTNPLIKSVSYVLYFFILLHSAVAVGLYIKNKKARPVGYKTSLSSVSSSWSSRNMSLLGMLILAFILMHLKDFWWHYKIMGGHNNNLNLYDLVVTQFQTPFSLITYVLGIIVLALHLVHGFQSAFQTLGINHNKYTPFLKAFGWIYSIIVSLGFLSMPIYVYFFM